MLDKKNELISMKSKLAFDIVQTTLVLYKVSDFRSLLNILKGFLLVALRHGEVILNPQHTAYLY